MINIQFLCTKCCSLNCVALQISLWARTADPCPCWEDARETQESQGHSHGADGSGRARCGTGQAHILLITQPIYFELMGYLTKLICFCSHVEWQMRKLRDQLQARKRYRRGGDKIGSNTIEGDTWQSFLHSWLLLFEFCGVEFSHSRNDLSMLIPFPHPIVIVIS